VCAVVGPTLISTPSFMERGPQRPRFRGAKARLRSGRTRCRAIRRSERFKPIGSRILGWVLGRVPGVTAGSGLRLRPFVLYGLWGLLWGLWGRGRGSRGGGGGGRGRGKSPHTSSTPHPVASSPRGPRPLSHNPNPRDGAQAIGYWPGPLSRRIGLVFALGFKRETRL
jgi:hypothetical protein